MHRMRKDFSCVSLCGKGQDNLCECCHTTEGGRKSGQVGRKVSYYRFRAEKGKLLQDIADTLDWTVEADNKI